MTNELPLGQGVLVLSPPRCGSSCVRACISFQGFSLGKTPTDVQDVYNAKGYFENRRVLEFNRAALRRVRTPIYTSTPLSNDQANRTMAQQQELKELLAEEFGSCSRFVIKDPRIVLLRRLYLSLLPEVKIVCLTRSREAAANSMTNIDQKSTRVRRFLPVWDCYMSECEQLKDELGDRVYSLKFEEFLEDPIAKTKELCSFLSVPFLPENGEAVLDFIDPKLVRYGKDV